MGSSKFFRAILFLFFFQALTVGSSFSQANFNLIGHLELEGVCTDVWGYVDPLTQKEYALVGCDGLNVIDISNPKSPVRVAKIDSLPFFDLKVYKNYLYLVTGGTGLAYVVDLTIPDQPKTISSFPSAHNITIDPRGFIYAEFPGLTIYDIRENPENPKKIYESGGSGGHDATIVGDVLYDFHGGSGTNIYNVKNPGNPVLLSAISDPGIKYHHSGYPTEDGDYLFICDEAAKGEAPDITVWDIRDFDRPKKVTEIFDFTATVHNLYIIGNFAYVSYYSAGVKIFDISNPEFPILMDTYDTAPESEKEGFTGVFGIYPYSLQNKLLVSDRNNGFFIFGSNTEKSKNLVFNIIPSIVQNELRLQIFAPDPLDSSPVYYEIIGLDGKIKAKGILKNSFGLNNNFIDVSGLYRGHYFVRIEKSNNVQVGRFIKQ
jgi:choice-of-anchor B domain-containing protein